MPLLTDTSPEAERLLVEINRRLTASEKIFQMGEIYRTAKALHAAGVRLRNPAATENEILDAWIAQFLTRSQLQAIRESKVGRAGA